VARQPLAPDTVAAPPYNIRRDDSVRFLRSLEDGSVDLIVTDPAYSGMHQHMQFGRGEGWS
jgi:DNA modification methylase